MTKAVSNRKICVNKSVIFRWETCALHLILRFMAQGSICPPPPNIIKEYFTPIWLKWLKCQFGEGWEGWDAVWGTSAGAAAAVPSCSLYGSFNSLTRYLIPILLGGGASWAMRRKFSEECPCSHHNIIVLIKQISLFDTTLVMKNI